jgi:hypothetical protein
MFASRYDHLPKHMFSNPVLLVRTEGVARSTHIGHLVTFMPGMPLDVLQPDPGRPHAVHKRQEVDEQVPILDRFACRCDKIVP